MKNKFYKEKETDQVFWVVNNDEDGVIEFSFDKKRTFNLFRDYPWALTKKQKSTFDEEQPFWADFFSDRKYDAESYEAWKMRNHIS